MRNKGLLKYVLLFEVLWEFFQTCTKADDEQLKYPAPYNINPMSPSHQNYNYR